MGVLTPGALNAITDVDGVKVGHFTLIAGNNIRTGVTAILPHGGNIFQEKVPAAIHIANGFGKLAGYSQVEELGNIETPIILTNTLSVPAACEALMSYTLNHPSNGQVKSVNPVVGETNDGYLNDIRGRHIRPQHVLNAIANAGNGPVKEGNVGAGTGTRSFGYKGGIGTASRKVPRQYGGYTVGVLVQSNFGGVLQIAGVPVAKEWGRYYLKDEIEADGDGSCMIVVATDAPLDARNLKRLAKRAMLGLARTGGIASNGSGDYVIAFSTAQELRIPYHSSSLLEEKKILKNDAMSPLFLACIEATEESIINALLAAEPMESDWGSHTAKCEALPVAELKKVLIQYGRIDKE